MSEQSTIRYGPGKVPYFNKKGRIFRPLVYIASPYSGDTEKNVERARAYCRYAVEQNAIPFAPHLLLPQFMNDEDERELAIFMDMVFLGKCSELWVFGSNITEGMQREIDKATKRHQTIRYFTEEMQEIKV